MSILFLFSCTTKSPNLEKYGWNKFKNKQSITNVIENELCHAPPNHYDDKVWYISSKKDYLVCDKQPFTENFCRGYTICYNMNEYFACYVSFPFQGWKGDWESARPDKLSKEQRAENDKRGLELFGVKSCEQKNHERKSENKEQVKKLW